MLEQLPSDEKVEVNRVATVASRISDYNYYLTNYRDGEKLKKAVQVVAKYKGRNSCLIQSGVILYIFPGSFISMGIFSGGEINIGSFFGVGLWIAGLALISRWSNTRGYKKAIKIVKKLDGELNLELFIQLDSEFGGEIMMQQRQKEARQLVQNFFGDSQLLPRET